MEKFVFFTCLFLIFSGIIYLFVDTMNIENPKYTVGTCIDFKGTGTKGTNTSRFKYHVRGYQYTVSGLSDPTIVVGDKFIVCYNSEEPGEARLVRHKPVFMKSEKTAFTVGVITGISTGNPSVVFEYVVNGARYERHQGILGDNKNKNLQEGDKYEVSYWIENPQRSIINLKKKVN